MKRGSCLCGAVAFESEGPWRDVIACHCTQCRKTTGHFWAATSVPTDRLTITNDDGLTWFQSSDIARRGFCNQCGASLFYELAGEGRTSIGAGCLDGQTGLKTEKHIWVDAKGDYYSSDDGTPQIGEQ